MKFLAQGVGVRGQSHFATPYWSSTGQDAQARISSRELTLNCSLAP